MGLVWLIVGIFVGASYPFVWSFIKAAGVKMVGSFKGTKDNDGTDGSK